MSLLKRIEGPVSPSPSHLLNKAQLRKWWQDVVREQGHYACYAIFLVLPSDGAAISYLINHADELGSLSGEHCFVIALSRKALGKFGFDIDVWGETRKTIKEVVSRVLNPKREAVVKEDVAGGYSARFAELFDIAVTELPCLVVFQAIRSSNHVVVSLKEMTEREIAKQMRMIFSIIQTAVIDQQEPLAAIEKRKNNEALLNKGKNVISDLRGIASKTLEAGMETWINAILK